MVRKEDITAHFKLRPRPQGFRELAVAFRFNRQEQKKLKRLLDEMLHAGELVQTRKGMYAPPAEINLIRGHFEAHKDGYGFVIPETPGQRDVFVPPSATMGAMSDDRVIARVEAPGRKGRIIRILERVRKKVSGTVEMSRTACYVRPKAKHLQFDVYIPPAGCAGVKNGQKVVVEITEYPTEPKRPPSGRILKVLREPEKPLEEIDAIIEEFDLPGRFQRKTLEEAKNLIVEKREIIEEKEIVEKKEISGKREMGRRKDLRGLPTVTIDGERAKDFDDAVSITLADIGYKLWVHIADVSHFVGWDSAIDMEARQRGTSVYFPDRVIPMLPPELSEDICSLVAGRERLTFTVQMDFDRYGKRFAAEFYPSLILSDERMTYTDVNEIIVGGDRGLRDKYKGLLKEFELMAELASLLRQRRLQRGSLDFDLPEPEVLLDMQGRPEAIMKSERNLAHILIEEFMVAANEAVAEHLQARGAPSLYRVHEGPDPEKVAEVLRLAGGLMKKRLPDYPALLEAARGGPEEEIITYMVLRGLKQARYSNVNAGHFGLASDCYTHFTSPIRRYPDLVVHRVLKELLASGKKEGALPEKRIDLLNELLPAIALQSSRTERNADFAEKAALDALKAWFMRERIGEEFAGRIIGVNSYGLRVRFDDFFVEGFLHVSTMTEDFYRFDEKTLSLSGKHSRRRFSIGDKIAVRVDGVNMEEKEVLLGLPPRAGNRKQGRGK